MHSVHIFYSDKFLLEVIVEELIVAAEGEDLLLFELTNNQLLHLCLGEAAINKHLLDLGESALLF